MSVLDDILATTRIDLERRRAAAGGAIPPAAQGRRPHAFRDALATPGLSIIAEHKRASPSAGAIRSGASVGEIARAYERGGASAISVLTEERNFDGSLDDLREAHAAVSLPLLRKDFIVDPYQVLEARAAGAGGLLVILRMLPPARIVELLDACADHGLFVLLEAFDGADLEAAAGLLTARRNRRELLLVGVNCRDLQTLEVVPQRFAALAAHLPPGPAVAESGVATPADALAMRRLGYRLALIGTALMARDDPAALLADILESTRAPG